MMQLQGLRCTFKGCGAQPRSKSLARPIIVLLGLDLHQMRAGVGAYSQPQPHSHSGERPFSPPKAYNLNLNSTHSPIGMIIRLGYPQTASYGLRPRSCEASGWEPVNIEGTVVTKPQGANPTSAHCGCERTTTDWCQ
jgi:hypothetical protein